MTNLDSIIKSRGTTFPKKVHLVKAMVFPVVMYGCESWTLKKVDLVYICECVHGKCILMFYPYSFVPWLTLSLFATSVFIPPFWMSLSVSGGRVHLWMIAWGLCLALSDFFHLVGPIPVAADGFISFWPTAELHPLITGHLISWMQSSVRDIMVESQLASFKKGGRDCWGSHVFCTRGVFKHTYSGEECRIKGYLSYSGVKSPHAVPHYGWFQFPT